MLCRTLPLRERLHFHQNYVRCSSLLQLNFCAAQQGLGNLATRQSRHPVLSCQRHEVSSTAYKVSTTILLPRLEQGNHGAHTKEMKGTRRAMARLSQG